MFAFIQLMMLIEGIGVVIGVYVLMRPVTSKFVFKYRSKLIFGSFLAAIFAGIISALPRGLDKIISIQYVNDMLTLFFGGMGLIFGIICILAKIFHWTVKDQGLKIYTLEIKKDEIELIQDLATYGPFGGVIHQYNALQYAKYKDKLLIFEVPVDKGDFICEYYIDKKDPNIFHITKVLNLNKQSLGRKIRNVIDMIARCSFVYGLLIMNREMDIKGDTFLGDTTGTSLVGTAMGFLMLSWLCSRPGKVTSVPEKLFIIVAWGMYIIAGTSLFENLFCAIMGA